MKTIVETISVARARDILRNHNTGNRPMSATHVAFLAKEIKQGRWQVTHQGIAFDENGNLIDGQHRLAAIVSANQEIQVTVTYGQSSETFSVLDRSRIRSAADGLYQIGVKDSKLIASILRSFRDIEDGSLASFSSIPPRDMQTLYARARHLLYPFCESRTGFPSAVIASLVYASQKYPDETRKFFEHLKTGANLSTNHPALKLRDFARMGARSHGGAVGVSRQKEQVLRTLTALRAFIEGREISKLYASQEVPSFFAPKKAGAQ